MVHRLNSCKHVLKNTWLRAETLLGYATWLGFRNVARIQRIVSHPFSLALPGEPRGTIINYFFYLKLYKYLVKIIICQDNTLIIQLPTLYQDACMVH